ncbi:MAG: hypothetical protein JJ939_08865 [Alphaproteobacteria bacterium]|nr:hypothetical protein [Rhodobiaceae bacterium]MBO6542747.1 hypothetical protein [Alphaproteobacteria bacterium]MBO6628519.1 hypothetical protein [Alphaproteobacteria bacterium]MDF1626182.1 hypothetical protein [Parvibaculaceae bacterium]
MTVRVMMAGLAFGMGFASLAMAADSEALRDYDRASLDSLFEQAQSSGGIVGIADDDDMLVTGSINKNMKKAADEEAPSPYPGAIAEPAIVPPAPLPTSRPPR